MDVWRVHKALDSVRSLNSFIGELTETEVLHVLKVESASLKRKMVMNKLILKAAELNRLTYIQTLKEKCYGKK